MTVLDNENKDCTGCGLCKIICPVSAVEMEEDEYGYIYPHIGDNCINCGRCFKVCKEIKKGLKSPEIAYAAARKDDKIMNSSSGGVFAKIAEIYLQNNEVVCGCRLEADMTAKHVCIEKIEELDSLLGSKYVQSSIEDVFIPLKKYLEAGKKVLFCGTPCQVAAIKEYTGNPESLVTIDLICHGVPSNKIFKEYIEEVKKEKHIDYVDKFIFRDKKYGWSYNSTIYYYKKGKYKKSKIMHRFSSYMSNFLNCDTYRESCYNCIYASPYRCGDITIGDYWGIVKQCPEVSQKIDISKGVSCCMVNTNKGRQVLNNTVGLYLQISEYEKIIIGNEPLNTPSVASNNREKFKELYDDKGYAAVHKQFRKEERGKKAIFWVIDKLPLKIQQILRNIRDIRK